MANSIQLICKFVTYRVNFNDNNYIVRQEWIETEDCSDSGLIITREDEPNIKIEDSEYNSIVDFFNSKTK